MKKDCTIYSLENCMTRKQRLKWKKDYARTRRFMKLYTKRKHRNIFVFNLASAEARIRVINRTNKKRRKERERNSVI